MRIEVEGVGRFGTRARIEGLGEGVNILAAPNEAGKSTFFRAIRACLFERHSSNNADLRVLASEGLSLPVSVTLAFAHDGVAYEIAKSFLKSPSARLKRNGADFARDREADERIWEMLGIAPGGGRSVDEAAFGILWVGQGKSFDLPSPTESATSALNAAIQEEVGILVGGERARQVLTKLTAEIAKVLTDKGKPRAGGALAEAAREAEAAASDLQEAEVKLAALDRSLDELAKLRGEHRRQADPADTARLKQELDEARRQLKAGEEAAELLRRCAEDERKARDLLAVRERDIEALRERARRIDDGRRRTGEIATQLAPLDEEEAETQRRLTDALADMRGFDSRLAALDEADRRLQHLLAVAERAQSRDALAEKLAGLQAHEKRFAENAAALAANPTDQAAITSLDEIEREEAMLAARREAAAARVTVERRGAVPVAIDGQPVENATARAVTEPMSISVGDLATVTVSPAQSGFAKAQAEKEKLHKRKEELLDRYGAASAAGLRRLRQERMALEAASAGLLAERGALGLKKAQASAEIAQLAAAIAQIDAERDNLLAQTGKTALPTPQEIDSSRGAVQEERAELRARRSECEAPAEGYRKVLTRIGSQRGTLRGQLQEIASGLAADLAVLPDERRPDIVRAAEQERERSAAEHRRSELRLLDMGSQAPGPDEIERLRARTERLGTALDSRAREIETLGRGIANLEGQIEAAGGDGLGEKVADLRARREIAAGELARQSGRVETLRLLRAVVEECYERRRRELNAPLLRHLKPFLHDLFPAAEIELGENFAVVGLRRQAVENFKALSDGTREQLAVLVRLAMGAMLGERGHEVPVILDDALVFSDDDRIERMFDALVRAGKKQQVVILTCRSKVFASLGARQLRIEA
jgi:chromosome segregation ATPase